MPPALLELVKLLTKGLLECGFTPERRPYRAHVCLARKVGGRIPEVDHEPLKWDVRQFHLIESKTYPDGARYTVLASWPLCGPTEDLASGDCSTHPPYEA